MKFLESSLNFKNNKINKNILITSEFVSIKIV